jgi:hypothetical protein
MDTELLAFLLRDPQRFVNNEVALRTELQAAKSWIVSLTETAISMNVSRSQLCRQIFPFSEDTDAKDQANIDCNDACPLRKCAVRVRKFLRLKISDENDLKQAVDALSIIESCLPN